MDLCVGAHEFWGIMSIMLPIHCLRQTYFLILIIGMLCFPPVCCLWLMKLDFSSLCGFLASVSSAFSFSFLTCLNPSSLSFLISHQWILIKHSPRRSVGSFFFERSSQHNLSQSLGSLPVGSWFENPVGNNVSGLLALC